MGLAYGPYGASSRRLTPVRWVILGAALVTKPGWSQPHQGLDELVPVQVQASIEPLGDHSGETAGDVQSRRPDLGALWRGGCGSHRVVQEICDQVDEALPHSGTR